MTLQNSFYRIFDPNNSFFILARNAKRLPHIGFSSLLLPLLFIGVGGVIVQFVLFPLIIGDPKQVSNFTKNAFVLFTLFSLVIIVVWLWAKYVEGRPFSSIGLIRENALTKYLFGFSTGLITREIPSLMIQPVRIKRNLMIRRYAQGTSGFMAITVNWPRFAGCNKPGGVTCKHAGVTLKISTPGNCWTKVIPGAACTIRWLMNLVIICISFTPTTISSQLLSGIHFQKISFGPILNIKMSILYRPV